MAIEDPYGTDVLLTNDGDLAVNAAGQLELIDGPLNCAQAMVGRLRTYEGELPLHPDYGNALEARITGSKANDPQLVTSIVNAELREILQDDRRFLSAAEVTVSFDPVDLTRHVVSATFELAGGDTISTGDLADPTLAAFEAAPSLADAADADGLFDFAGEDDDEDLPDIDEVLEGADAHGDDGED